MDEAGNIIAGSYERSPTKSTRTLGYLYGSSQRDVGCTSGELTKETPAAIPISFFILIVGGFLGIINKTGALDAGIATVVKRFKGKEKMLIPVLMLLFAFRWFNLWNGGRNDSILRIIDSCYDGRRF